MSTSANEPGSMNQDSPIALDFARRALESALDRDDGETVGAQIGPYQLRQKIGEGGFGAVWLAEQREPLRRSVALKIVKVGMDTEEVMARFEVERQALALMDHPNIARVYDAGATAIGRPYFVMELVRGVPITQYCDANRMTAEARLRLFLPVCHAVQHAHQKGIIHRDIKPSNILVTLHDGVPVPKVIDFGIAKATGRRLTERTLVTQFHAFVGTPVYTSPEQMEMSGLDVDTRSDIYSLGVLLYELLAGRLPFEPDTLARSGLEAMRRVIREVDPPRPSHRLGTLSEADRTAVAGRRGTDTAKLTLLLRGDLDWIVMRCLEKDRGRRYGTANDLANDLVHHLRDEPVDARAPGRCYRLQKFIRRNQLAVAAGLVVAAALTAGGLLAAWQAVRATRAEREQSRLRTVAETAAGKESHARQRAEQQTARARQESQRATEAAERLRLQAYVSDIRAAESALEIVRVLHTAEGLGRTSATPAGEVRHSLGGHFDLGRCRALLERQVPAAGEEDLRGFEWRYLWALSRSHAIAEYRQSYFQVTHADLLPDAKTLIAGCGDSAVAVWDTSSRQVLHTFRSADNEWWLDRKTGLSPDGARMVVCHDRGVSVYDTTSWQIVAQHPMVARMAAFIPHSDELVLLSKNALVFWNPATGAAETGEIDVTTYWARLLPAPDGRRVYVITRRLTVEVWRVASRQREQALACGNLAVSLAASPDGRWLATGHSNGTVALWSAIDWTLHGTTWAHDKWGMGLAFSPDSRLLASGGSDQLIRLWDVPDSPQSNELRLRDTLQGHRGMVSSLSFTADGRQLVSAGNDWTVRVWPVSPEGRKPLEFGIAPRTGVPSARGGLRTVLVPSARLGLVWATNGNDWVGWNFRTGKAVRTARFTAVAPARWTRWVENWGGRRIYGTEEGVFSWDPLTERTEPLVSVTGSSGLAALITQQGRDYLLLELPSPRRIEAWAPGATAPCREPWTRVLTALAASVSAPSETRAGAASYHIVQSPDGWQLACMPRDDVQGQTDYPVLLAALDGTSRVRKLAGHLKDVYSFAFSPDGSLAASGSLDTMTRLWDLASCDSPRFLLRGHNAPVHLQQFTPDGRTLLSGGGDVIRFWNVRSGEELLAIPGKEVTSGDALGPHRWLVPSENDDGLLTFSYSEGGTVRFTPVPSLAAIDEEIRRAASTPGTLP